MNELAAQSFSRENLELIKSSVAKGATDSELQLFLHRCRNLGLDPLKPGQIYFVKYGTSPGSIVVGIDGFRARANATGKHRGTKRGVTRNDKGTVTHAWCEVFRDGWTEPAREEVSMAEYNTGKSLWQKMPETMLKKVAEAAALRMAFPDELGGIYASEEMDQAAPREAVSVKVDNIMIENKGADVAAKPTVFEIPDDVLGMTREVEELSKKLDADTQQTVLNTLAESVGNTEKIKKILERVKVLTKGLA